MPILSPLLGTDCGICTAYDEQYIVCSMNVKFDTDAIGKAWNGMEFMYTDTCSISLDLLFTKNDDLHSACSSFCWVGLFSLFPSLPVRF